MTPTPATLTEFKEYLNKNNISPGEDSELELHLEAATEAAEGWAPKGCAPVGPLVVREFTERATAENGVLILARTPVVSVTSATRVPDGLEYVTADLDVDGAAGIVSRLSGCIARGRYDVVYEAGRDPVPTSLVLATLVIGGHMWATQRGPRTRNLRGQTEETGFRQGAGYLIPNQAATLMQSYTSVLVG